MGTRKLIRRMPNRHHNQENYKNRPDRKQYYKSKMGEKDYINRKTDKNIISNKPKNREIIAQINIQIPIVNNIFNKYEEIKIEEMPKTIKRLTKIGKELAKCGGVEEEYLLEYLRGIVKLDITMLENGGVNLENITDISRMCLRIEFIGNILKFSKSFINPILTPWILSSTKYMREIDIQNAIQENKASAYIIIANYLIFVYQLLRLAKKNQKFNIPELFIFLHKLLEIFLHSGLELEEDINGRILKIINRVNLVRLLTIRVNSTHQYRQIFIFILELTQKAIEINIQNECFDSICWPIKVIMDKLKEMQTLPKIIQEKCLGLSNSISRRNLFQVEVEHIPRKIDEIPSFEPMIDDIFINPGRHKKEMNVKEMKNGEKRMKRKINKERRATVRELKRDTTTIAKIRENELRQELSNRQKYISDSRKMVQDDIM